MDAKELRIGNLTEQGEIKNFWEKGTHVGFGKCFEFNELSPIPITEEWLEKFGFERDNLDEDNAWLNLRYRYLNFSSDESVEFKKVYLTVNKMDIICEYVHQLQNLYFALTGEELTIKE